MKKLLTLFLVFCCLLTTTAFSPVEVEAANKNNIKMYTTTAVNMREKPTINSKIIKTWSKGSAVTVTHVGKKWNTVKYKSKKYYICNRYLSKTKPKLVKTQNTKLKSPKYSASYFKRAGVIKWGEWKWTWYSQRVLPGGGLKIPGRHVGPDGYVMDKYGRICLASSSLKKGTVVNTPFGAKGCIYDSGCGAGIVDVYVNW